MLNQIEKARRVYAEYPGAFWALVTITFIDRVGGAMIFPFFGLKRVLLAMVVAPSGQALVAKFAPEEKRERYMAVFGYSWGISFMIGPYLAGLALDNFDPRFLWYVAGIIGTLAVMSFLGLYRRLESNEESSQATTTQPV